VIIPDLPPEEGKSFIKLASRQGLDVICFIASTTSKERRGQIAKIAKGFIYYVSLTGVTGPRRSLPKDLLANLKVIKKNTAKPICVGFGVSSVKQVKEIQRVADGVIVGSAIVEKIRENIDNPSLIKRVGNFAYSLKR
jgi:tryptophan synthase alpha chain